MASPNIIAQVEQAAAAAAASAAHTPSNAPQSSSAATTAASPAASPAAIPASAVNTAASSPLPPATGSTASPSSSSHTPNAAPTSSPTAAAASSPHASAPTNAAASSGTPSGASSNSGGSPQPSSSALASLVTQVKQGSPPVNSAKSTIEAAKKRVAKLDVASSTPASVNGTTTTPTHGDNDEQKPDHSPSVSASSPPKTPVPPSPHTDAALSAIQAGTQQPAPIATMAVLKTKKRRSAGPSFWSRFFPCCCTSADDDTTNMAMAPVNKHGASTANKQQQHQSAKSKSQPANESRKWLLKPLAPEDHGRKCLVLDLDETLVHSSFKPVAKADFVIPVEIDKTIHNVYVLKRPGVDTFMQRLGAQFEIVVFTASLSKYADPVLDILDKHKVVKHRLFREACIHHKGNYVKDLSLLGRDLKEVIIIDNSPSCYMFHPTNAVPISSWFDDPNDTELLELIPFLEDLRLVENVTAVLDNSLDD